MDEITTAVDGPALTITINRPAKRNALTTAMYRELATALRDHRDVRVVVLTGTGGVFSAGNDLGDFVGDFKADDAVRQFQEAVLDTTAVLVAAVDGPAVGIGATLLLHCDLVYATERSYLQFPFVNLGVVPEFGSSLLLAQRVGRQRAAELLLFGDRLPATTAQELGLVNEVLVNVEELHTRVKDRVSTLLAKPARSLQETRALLHNTIHPHDQLERESVVFGELLDDPDTKARIEAMRR
ncbi:enoyl-CoA hydratase-related protein [Kutzneria kofuensis]|uniref:Enoyl-CoA hydratase/carnithine racemase n=1 Tax=Kutzneria kofuensis TaxID=103725 RepID=A0A7W9KS46_9PSEU|nr:enoyl-CoA hydratase-related protein [Kutzneria kofuensis]MBB5897393.1 enoyl-CoA hydratase/carnithine racemase [Kutzneria kofuensis]